MTTQEQRQPAQEQRQPSTAMAIIDTREAPIATAHFGADRVGMVVEQLSRGWKRPMELAELEHIGLICDRTRLDPLVKPALIYFIQRFDKQSGKHVMTPQVSIDGLRIIAARSRDYVTQVGPEWCGPDGKWRDIWTDTKPPAAARVGVVRRGTREPLWSVALWQECNQGTSFWQQRPAHMLAKTAEGNALKRACPAETNELELAHLEEMERLEVPARAEAYVRIFGDAGGGFGFQGDPALPEPKYVPPRERTDLEDLPRPSTTEPPSPKRQQLIDGYARLVKEAIELHVIVGDAVDWIARAGGTDLEIIEHGRSLRALVNNKKLNNAKGGMPPVVEAEEEFDPSEAGEGDDWGVGDTNSGPATDEQARQMAGVLLEEDQKAAPPKVISARSALAQKLAAAIEEAAKAGIEWQDCKPDPMTEEAVIRATEKLTDRIDAFHRSTTPEQQQAMV